MFAERLLNLGVLLSRRSIKEAETFTSSKDAFMSEMSLYLKDKRQRTAAASLESQVKLWIQIAENHNLPLELRESATRKIDKFLGN